MRHQIERNIRKIGIEDLSFAVEKSISQAFLVDCVNRIQKRYFVLKIQGSIEFHVFYGFSIE
jgi:hypothetical protein